MTNRFTQSDQQILRGVAKKSIHHGLDKEEPLPITLTDYDAALRENAASFVTLEIEGKLRGCIGHLVAFQPLVVDVSANAFAAAFQDPRFQPLSADEFEKFTLLLSVLSQPEPLPCASEAELLTKIRQGVDGIILIDGPHRATFLPAVWENLSDPKDFLRQLKLKAGLSANHWSRTTQIQRYTTESF